VLAWGINTSGQTNVPPSATNIIAIAAGASHSLALRADGRVIGWGLNSSGQATALSNAVNVVAIAAGGNQSLALLADGSVVGRIITNTPGAAVFYGPPPGNTSNKIALAAGIYHSLDLGANRVINGWGATNFGQLTVPYFATNALTIAAGGDFSLALLPDPFAPPIPARIGRPPLSRTVTSGQNIIMNALAIGGLPLACEWYHDGLPLPGQTNQWLAFPSVLPRDGGNYQLVAMNAFGAATSAVAVLTVNIPLPVLKPLGFTTNGFSFTFQSVSGVLYIVEYKTALGSGPWAELERRFGLGGLEVVTDPVPVSAMRLYRVRALYAPAPRLGSASFTGGSVTFGFPTVPGAVYVVQYKNHLEDPVWLELSRQSATGSSIIVADPGPASVSRFYRVQVQ
jgi:hypothetical protein